MAVLIAVVAFVGVLGLLVLIHEFGHYAVAKLCGVRVEVFSIGFGKRLLGFRKGDTDYRISALPLGGYVKMSGENPLEPSTGDPGEFMSHPRWQRFLIALAGPAMNILFAVGVTTGIFMVHYERPIWWDKPAEIGWVIEESPAAKAGLQVGDRIIRIDGVDNPTWEDVFVRTSISAEHPVSLTVQRSDQIIPVSMIPSKERLGTQEIGVTGMVAAQPNTVTRITPGSPAEQAGLKLGDEILTVNKIPIRTTSGLLAQLQKTKDQPVEMAVLRNGQQFNLTVTPRMQEIEGDRKFRIGVQSDPMRVAQLPFRDALRKSLDESWKNSFLLIEIIERMVKRQISIKQLSGPVGIAGAAGEAAQQRGWLPLVAFAAFVSLQLGLFNLLPIPIMDGGVILLLAIEGIMRRDINARIKERIYQAAFVFLILFAVVVIYNDISKLPGLGKFLP